MCVQCVAVCASRHQGDSLSKPAISNRPPESDLARPPLSARVCVGRGVYVSRASVAARSSIVRRLEHRFSSSTEGAPRAPVAPPPARQRSPRADMTWPCESVGRACFTAEKCSLTYLAKADGSRLAAGVPSRLKAPSSTSSPRQRPHLVRVRD